MLHSNWDGKPVAFGNFTRYSCIDDKHFFEMDKSLTTWIISCLSTGKFDTPKVWPICVKSK